MNVKLSLVNLFLSPVAVHIALSSARVRKVENFYHQKIAVYCPAELKPFLIEALDDAVRFFGDEWPAYQKQIKRIIFDDKLDSIVWVARRTIIVSESDQLRVKSPRDLAGWLVSDFERIKFSHDRKCATLVWNKNIPLFARQQAQSKRAQFLAK